LHLPELSKPNSRRRILTERDKELRDQATLFENDAINLAIFADLIRADEREAILKLADSLGWVSVDDIRARGNT